MTQEQIERFWKNVNIGEGNECWPWLGAKSWDGYGSFGPKRSHRLAYELRKASKIPPGMHCLHTCDNRACCNPDHLFIGTNTDNVADKVAKGRQSMGKSHSEAVKRAGQQVFFGEQQPNAKLTEGDVRQIRQQTEAGMTRREVAKLHGISASNVQAIYRRKTWVHL